MIEVLNSIVAAAVVGGVAMLWKIGIELTRLRVIISNLESYIKEIRRDIDDIEEDIDEMG